MKTSNYISIFGLLAFLLSSCGSLSISQKRYSRGLNIDWFSAKEDKGIEQKQSSKKVRKLPEFQMAQNTEVSAELTSAIVEMETPAFRPVTAGSSLNPLLAQASATKNNGSVKAKSNLVSKVTVGLKNTAQKMVQKAPVRLSSKSIVNQTSDSDVNLILLVLLAIFIPPLAVYLYFGEITAHFWINIILCLVGGGIGGAVGYWGLGIIHALLVVFGIFG